MSDSCHTRRSTAARLVAVGLAACAHSAALPAAAAATRVLAPVALGGRVVAAPTAAARVSSLEAAATPATPGARSP